MLDNNCISKEVEEPDTVAHTCNPSYLGGRNWEDPGLRPAWVKSQLNRPPTLPSQPVAGPGGVCLSSQLRSSGIGLGKNTRPYPKNN
jgi:hypothetical protein